MKKLSILGSTGSIGTQTLDVVRQHPNDFKVVGISAYGSERDVELLVEQIKEFKPKAVAVYKEEAVSKIKDIARENNCSVYHGQDSLVKIATMEEADTLVTAVVGSVGLVPTLEAIKAKKNIALANKETLVCAGSIVMREVKRHGVSLMPIDSEHSAIFQSLQGNRRQDLRRIILTCSGGPFREWTKDQIDQADREQALKHPTWNMGGKITVDSATLMNKGLEVIEAHWLYDVPYDQISVVVHPQSIIHSMVEYIDGSIIAQLGVHDMRLPIQYALSYPTRLTSGSYAFLDLVKTHQLTFYEPDLVRFPSLAYAYEAGRLGGTMPTVMNAANEVAVMEYFLKGLIKVGDITKVVRHTMDIHKLTMYRKGNAKIIEKLYRIKEKFGRNLPNFNHSPNIDSILIADKWAREHTRSVLNAVVSDGWEKIDKI
jgi:1-deoxy-D-xylulose-5-phosphate reductoisomerase